MMEKRLVYLQEASRGSVTSVESMAIEQETVEVMDQKEIRIKGSLQGTRFVIIAKREDILKRIVQS